jgi:hypothetical protein
MRLFDGDLTGFALRPISGTLLAVMVAGAALLVVLRRRVRSRSVAAPDTQPFREDV